MTERAWPFLKARTKSEGYRLVVVPDFMRDEQSRRHLEVAISSGNTFRGGATNIRVISVHGQPISLIYRVQGARSSDYGIAADGLLTDERRRAIDAVEGIAVRCDADKLEQIKVGSFDLDQSHKRVRDAYRRFWREEAEYSLTYSGSFALTGRGQALSLTAPAESPEPPEPGEPIITTGGTAEVSPTAYGARRKRHAMPISIAVLITAASVAILAVALPSTSPVLRPAGLRLVADQTSWVKLGWSRPATGPLPTTYEIFRDRIEVARIPGRQTSYKDSGLIPDSRYSYRIVAIRDKVNSLPSRVIAVRTTTPSISSATLSGSWLARYTITRKPRYQDAFRLGAKFTVTWRFGSQCAIRRCGVVLYGKIRSYRGRIISFTVPLTRFANSYRGQIRDNFDECVFNSMRIPGITSLQLKVLAAGLRQERWAVRSWSATMTIADGDALAPFCPASTVAATIRSSRSA